MAIKIQFRNDTAANAASVNPVLSQGEILEEYNSNQFKIGDGSTVYNSLTYQGTVGAVQTLPYKSFGDGSDGNVTISSGTTTLTRDMYYNNLTISGTGNLQPNCFKIFVKGTLDLTAAPAGAITSNGANGGDASGVTGGAAAAGTTSGTLGIGGLGTAGNNGTAFNGVTGTAPASNTGNGSGGNIAGSGGAGLTGVSASGRSAAVPTSLDIRRRATNLLRGAVLLGGGSGGAAGSTGGGDGINQSGGSGAGGNGGGIIAIYANQILKSVNSVASTIQAMGGNGGMGGTPPTGDCGGSGGGGAGGGGWVYIVYNSRGGPSIAQFISADGGMGGSGGNGIGGDGGLTTGVGGGGGAGSYGGRITVIDMLVIGNSKEIQGSAYAAYVPHINTGISAVLNMGGTGGLAGQARASL